MKKSISLVSLVSPVILKTAKRILLAGLCALLLFSLGSCGPADTGRGYVKDIVVVATNKNQTKAIFNIMQEKGFLREELPEGVSLQWSEISGFANIRDGLVAGQVDFVSTTGSGMIVSIENGYPILPIANSMGASAAIYSNNPEIATAADIEKAKTIGLNSLAGSYQYAFNKFEEREYGDATKLDARFIVLEFEDMMASLRTSRDLDVAIVAFPSTIDADQVETLTKIVDLTPIIEEYALGNFVFSSEKFVKENPALVEAFLRAERRAIDYMNQNRAEAAQLLSGLYSIEASYIEAELAKFPPSIALKAYDSTARFLWELGELEKEPKKFDTFLNYETIPQ